MELTREVNRLSTRTDESFQQKAINLQLREGSSLPWEIKTPISRREEPIQMGIPFPKGALHTHSLNNLSLANGHVSLPMSSFAIDTWPDGSVRWLQLVTRATLPTPLPSLTLSSTPLEHKSADGDSEPLSEQAVTDPYQIKDGPVKHTIELNPFRIISRTESSDQGWSLHLTLRNSNRSSIKAVVTAVSIPEEPRQSTLFEDRFIGGYFEQDGQPLAFRFNLRCRFYLQDGLVSIEACLHNPLRARHAGGIWDLGDPGSLYFSEFGLVVDGGPVSNARLQTEPNGTIYTVNSEQPCRIYQDSSGGEHWSSFNHVDKNNEATTRFRGYEWLAGDQTGKGLRAQPILEATTSKGVLSAASEQFWQNFPNSLSITEDTLRIGLFPGESGQQYELQGGERKTHRLHIAFGATLESLEWSQNPVIPIVPAEQYEVSQALPWFKANPPKGPLDDLINHGINGPNNFFIKREQIDEYGWRNFGDLFADHESLYLPNDADPYISHYNNQYDAIYGFARQFALSGNPSWFKLMEELARHVTDIDIYHTDKDRTEYNNGLFWHTDHYLPAHTATHRTFSQHNTTSSTPGQTGGGPAAEHCYSTGLLYHHFLTGSKASRQAVLQLAGWMRALHEGQGGLLEQLLALKKHELPKVRALVRGKQPTRHTYPFTRGTGNYLNTLLDAWQLQPDHEWLTQAEKVIRHTIHPADDIEQRQLLNVETGWSYLVLLSSISRYLWLKARESQFDEAYNYARDALVHYTRWMLKNERLFLDHPDQLEFPNDTWTAQDIRKVMLLRQAASLDPENAENYLQQADTWLDDICNRLVTSDERNYTRIQIILLQNYGPHQAGIEKLDTAPLLSTIPSSPRLTWNTLTGRIAMRLARGLVTFRPTRERAWLNARLDRR